MAEDRLVIITGAGVSAGVERSKGGKLPNWGNLVSNLKHRAIGKMSTMEPNKKELLERLAPENGLEFVHGDALIEASEIIESLVDKADFCKWVAEETTEAEKAWGACHNSITAIAPKGIITFNYDRCHENSFESQGVHYTKMLHSESGVMRESIRSGFKSNPFIMKAHGCVSKPDSLVLTSSSYRKILNESLQYRAFMQHVLSRYTVLIVGFAIRDRDFDQILMTIERDYGKGIQDHIAIMKDDVKNESQCDCNENGRARVRSAADFAVLEARYGLQVLNVKEYHEIPNLILSIKETPGSMVHSLISGVISEDGDVRSASREKVRKLGSIGLDQFEKLLVEAITSAKDLKSKSELLYCASLVKSRNLNIVNILVEQAMFYLNFFMDNVPRFVCDDSLECIAHALLSLRNSTVMSEVRLFDITKALGADHIKVCAERADSYLEKEGKQARIKVYLESAIIELKERSLYHINKKRSCLNN
ncbi:SIR2 family NAD-dependent protein deacylase [Rheinheimera sp. SA_1]|uniref:SIR2 family NAD-dependent protein deacylase n=1 Tax=Rheinheimera sp. SA_1 TaxID=1827365 RepID=UPI0012F7FB87|nr:SIR2 family protein [Rheinheimera sp. SA_1]